MQVMALNSDHVMLKNFMAKFLSHPKKVNVLVC